jgi:DNA-binding NarL/FixJ family response regulator
MPQIGMYLIYDLKPFLRSGIWWYRSYNGTDQYMHYQSEDKKLQHCDLLSEREKLILEKVAEGMSSKEIGDLLYISQHTVDNHRRKMLAKTGAVDTSALIYVVKLSGIL